MLRTGIERLENAGEGISGYRRGSLKLTSLHRKEDTENILIRLLKKDAILRKTMGEKIKEAVKPYDWEIIIDKLESIYKELAAKR